MDNIIHQSLDGTWRLAVIHHEQFKRMPLPLSYDAVLAAAAIDGEVPGNFELDLYKAGKIPDPFFGTNLLAMLRYEDCHVFYARRFTYSPQAETSPELVFEGIDTIADIYLNGEFLAHTENMFVTHRIGVAGRLNAENEIVVHLSPVCIEARKNAVSAGNSHLRYNYECLRLRKAPSMFGWDISPRLVSAGIYRRVGIYKRPARSFRQLYLMTKSVDPERNRANLELFFDIDIGDEALTAFTISVRGNCGDRRFAASERLWFTAGKLAVSVEDAALWWPRGCDPAGGRPNLYQVTVTLEREGKPVDSYTTSLGIRKVSLVRTGTTDMFFNGDFHIEINGRRVFLMGTNWVPVDAYHSRDRERIPAIMKLLDDIGCNAVRCWGGNVYEDPLFYRSCDELGIMVWQDFAMACGTYPIDGEFAARIREEAVQVVRSLRQHPSIVLWAGDNECDEFIAGDGYGRDPNFNRITRETLPDVLAMEDPTRPFLPSSPYIDRDGAKIPRNCLSENHLWGPRDYFKSQFYQGSLCHFASEIGYHGSVSVRSMKKFISPDKLWPWQDNDEWRIHAASPEFDRGPYLYRIELMAKQIGELFGSIPDTLEDFVLASQASQAEAKKFFVELFRIGQPRRSGIIWWNLIDGWPQFSDAVVDYYFDKKLAYYYLRQSQQPLILSFAEPHDWKLSLVAVNNSGGPLSFRYTVRDFDTKRVLLSGTGSCGDQESKKLDLLPYSQGEKRIYLIEWESPPGDPASGPERRGRNHYLAGNPPFDLAHYLNFVRETYPEYLDRGAGNAGA
jgi:beta-mannosidase